MKRDANFPNWESKLLANRWGTAFNSKESPRLADDPMLSAEECAEKLGITVEEVDESEAFAAWKLFLYITEGVTWEQTKRPKRNWLVAICTALARPLVRKKHKFLSRQLAELEIGERKLSDEDVHVLGARWFSYRPIFCRKEMKYIGERPYSLAELNNNFIQLNRWQHYRQRAKHQYPTSIGVIEEMEFKALCLILQKLITRRQVQLPAWGETSGGPIIFWCMKEGYPRVDLHTYGVQCIIKIHFNWVWTGNMGDKQVITSFKLLNTGLIENIRVIEGSGNAELDQSAIDAIEQSSPLSPFPPDYPPELEVEFVFAQFLLEMNPADFDLPTC